jgi:hypothetical protein
MKNEFHKETKNENLEKVYRGCHSHATMSIIIKSIFETLAINMRNTEAMSRADWEEYAKERLPNYIPNFNEEEEYMEAIEMAMDIYYDEHFEQKD